MYKFWLYCKQSRKSETVLVDGYYTRDQAEMAQERLGEVYHAWIVED